MAYGHYLRGGQFLQRYVRFNAGKICQKTIPMYPKMYPKLTQILLDIWPKIWPKIDQKFDQKLTILEINTQRRSFINSWCIQKF